MDKAKRLHKKCRVIRRFPEKKILGSLPELVEGKFLELPSTSSGNGIIFSGNHLMPDTLTFYLPYPKSNKVKLITNIIS